MGEVLHVALIVACIGTFVAAVAIGGYWAGGWAGRKADEEFYKIGRRLLDARPWCDCPTCHGTGRTPEPRDTTDE